MVINGQSLLNLKPIANMERIKIVANGMSYGLSEAGYDIRIAQDITLDKDKSFSLASALEYFHMPDNLIGVVHDKSSWARQGLSVFNTILEPSWVGYLTLELFYRGETPLVIKAGSPIAQVIFHEIKERATYSGKYQNQGPEPTPSIYER